VRYGGEAAPFIIPGRTQPGHRTAAHLKEG
jgi:hypothetical protein